MKKTSLLLLRIAMGVLITFWGIDKLVHVAHAIHVSDRFYLGLFSSSMLLRGFGVFETLLGIFTITGLYRKQLYPVLIAVNAVSTLSVWSSIIDPWGWFLQGTHPLLQPTLLIFFAALVLTAFREEDTMALDARQK